MSQKDREAEKRRISKRAERKQRQQPQIRKWVSDKFLSDYFEVSRATIWRWVKIGKLPPPEKIGENCTRWDFEQIQKKESA